MPNLRFSWQSCWKFLSGMSHCTTGHVSFQCFKESYQLHLHCQAVQAGVSKYAPNSTAQHPTRTESSAVINVTVSKSRVKNQTNCGYGRVLLDNSHLFWVDVSRQVDQTAVSVSLYPCIMPHASNDQGKRKRKKKSYYESHHINVIILFTQFWHKKLPFHYSYIREHFILLQFDIWYFHTEQNKGNNGIANVVFSVLRAFRPPTGPPSEHLLPIHKVFIL